MMYRRVWNLFFIGIIALLLLSPVGIWMITGWKWDTINIENRNFVAFPALRPQLHDWKLALSPLKTGAKRLAYGNFQQAVEQMRLAFRSIDKQFGRVAARGWQRQVESAASDHYPYRYELTWLAKRIEQTEIQGAYLPFNDAAIPVTIDYDSVMVMRGRPVFLNTPKKFDGTTRKALDKRLNNFSDLIRRYPQLNFYLFYFDHLDRSNLHPVTNLFPQADRGDTLRYLQANKPDGLVLGTMTLENLDEYETLFFHTDHHWTIRGAWKAYESIYQMLAEHTPGIGPILTLKGFSTVAGVQYCGPYTRSTLYPCTPEPLEFADVDLPPYTTYVNGKQTPYGHRAEYLAGEFDDSLYAQHYRDFFGNQVALVEYHFANQSNRNLLMIGSSYTHNIQVYVAAHYRNAYIIDLRKYKDFSLGEFILHHSIDDVLVLDTSSLITDLVWLINP